MVPLVGGVVSYERGTPVPVEDDAGGLDGGDHLGRQTRLFQALLHLRFVRVVHSGHLEFTV